jgi:hypothetical protein
MGNFGTMGTGSKLSSEERYASNNRAASVSEAPGIQYTSNQPSTIFSSSTNISGFTHNAVAAPTIAQIHENVIIFCFYVDILLGLTDYKYRPLKRKPLKRRSRINGKSACLEVAHAVVATAANLVILNKLDPMVGLLLGADLVFLVLLPKLEIYRTSERLTKLSL